MRPAAARSLLNRALVLVTGAADVPLLIAAGFPADASTLLVRLVITIAKSEAELRGLRPALELLDTAERLADQLGDSTMAVSIANQRGLLYLRFGDAVRAIAEFDAADPMLSAAPPLDAAHVLLNRGVARLDRGELAEARKDLSRCVALAARSSLVTVEAMAGHNLGYLEFLAGNLPRGLDQMQAAARPEAGVPMGISYLDRARLLVEAGMTREADAALAQAITILRQGRSAQDVAEAELARAECALVAGDPQAARRYAARARTRFRRRENDTWRRRAELILLRCDLAVGRPGARLVGPALRLRGELADHGQRLPAWTASLITVEALLAADRIAPAVELLESMPEAGHRDPITARLHGRYVAAQVALAHGDRRAASAAVRRGLAELAEHRALFGSIDVRTASAVHGRRLAALDIALALDTRRAAAVFTAVERVRAIAARFSPVHPPRDPVSAALLAELRRTTQALRVGALDAAEMRSLQRRRQELEREITARRWTLPGSGRARPPASLAGVRGALAGVNATMVTFVESAATLHAIVVGDREVRLAHLGDAEASYEQVRRIRADIDVLANPGLPDGMRVAVSASLARSAAVLDESLLRPLCINGPMIAVTTGVLGQLPWSALPSARGRPVTVTPSATTWLAAVEASHTTAGGVVALGGPHLGRSAEECRAVVEAHRSATASIGPSATRAAFADAVTSASLVHVAAHGLHQTENPLFSSVQMADGPVFAHELEETVRTADHVVLSACELGLATVRPGDEALGLTRVLLHLGTRSVVAGVARVGDDMAAETMTAYHARLAAGDDSASALAQAVAGAPAGRPAPFVCFGSSWRLPPS